MMPARKRCHSARDSVGMTGESEVRPCLTALWRTAALLSGVFGPRFPIWYEVRCDGERQTSIGCHSFEKLFWSFGVWDYGTILEFTNGNSAAGSGGAGVDVVIGTKVRVVNVIVYAVALLLEEVDAEGRGK